MQLPTFNPTPTQADAVLDALADPGHSLLHIVKTHQTSTRALAHWLNRPDIRPHTQAIDDALTRRARSQAAAAFHALIAAATRAIDVFNALPAPTPQDKSTNPASVETYDRRCMGALRACSLLLRVARFDEPSRRHSPRDLDHNPPRHRRDIAAPTHALSSLPSGTPMLKPAPAQPARPLAAPPAALHELTPTPFGPVLPPITPGRSAALLASRAGLASGP